MGLFQEENKELVPLWELMRRDSQVVREVPEVRKPPSVVVWANFQCCLNPHVP